MTPVVSLGLLAVSLGLAVLGLHSLSLGGQQRRVAGRRGRLANRDDRVPAWRRVADTAVLKVGIGRSVEERLRRADLQPALAGDAVMVVLAGAAMVVFLASRLVTTPVAVLLGAAVVVLANVRLSQLVQRRADLFADQLPDIARIMAGAAGAGMAISNALALTARELQEPAHTLLSQAVRQMDVGQTLAGAMESLKDQAPSREMAVLVSTLVIQQRTGGDVIEALREMSVNLEERRDLKREVDTTMAGVRYTAYAVMGLGIAALGMVEALNGGSLRRMTERPLGQLVLLLAMGFYVAGYTATRHLSRVDV